MGGVIAAGKTDIGRKRSTNQDSIYMNPVHNIYLVADGMGGHRGGDMASALAVKICPEYFLANLNGDPSRIAKESIKSANLAIFKKSQSEAKLKGMGTTIVSLFFKTDTLYVANVGDSRAYLVNKQKIFQLSKDHSLVQEKLNVGLYNRQQAANDPMKNVLVRTVGYEELLEVDLFTYKVMKNDIIFICSDGLHGKVSDADITYLINKNIPNPEIATTKDLQKMVDVLIQQANDNGGQDNISLIMVITK